MFPFSQTYSYHTDWGSADRFCGFASGLPYSYKITLSCQLHNAFLITIHLPIFPHLTPRGATSLSCDYVKMVISICNPS